MQMCRMGYILRTSPPSLKKYTHIWRERDRQFFQPFLFEIAHQLSQNNYTHAPAAGLLFSMACN